MTSEELRERACRELPRGTPPLRGEALAPYREVVDAGWEVGEVGGEPYHLERSFTFPDFLGALHFTMLVGEVAEAAGHHPEITLTWGLARVRIWTHSIGGLSENDFILAARIDRLT